MPAGTASIIVAAAPLVSVAIAGVALVGTSRSNASVTSTIWIVIAAAIVQGIYHPLTKPLLRRYTGLEVATYGMVVGVVLTLPFIGFAWTDLSSASTSAWSAAVYLGVVPSAVGFLMWGYTVARVPVATSTSLLYLVPAAAIVIAYLWLGEKPILAELFGGIVVIAGVAAVTLAEPVHSWIQRHRAPSPDRPQMPHRAGRS